MYKLRYIVPFSWTGTYQDMFGSLSQTAFMACRENAYAGSKGHSDSQEQDVYEHILKNFSDDPDDHNAIGSVWEINLQKLPDKPYRLAWYPNAAIEKYYELNIKGMGIYLFRNRIGFLWYELEARKEAEQDGRDTDSEKGKQKKYSDSLDEEELIHLQYSLKEINRIESKATGARLFEMDKDFRFTVRERELIRGRIDNQEEGLHHFEERIVLRDGRPVRGDKKEDDTVRGVMFREFTFGHWIAGLMNTITNGGQVDIQYFTGKTDTLQSAEQRSLGAMIVPDKVNLFNYVGIPEDKMDRLAEYGFFLSNGYKRSYLYREGDLASARFLFANVCCYASQEGCGYYYAPTVENRGFFEGNMTSKIMLDYFFLYVLALHQYYSLIVYARRIAEELPSEPADYVQDEKTREKLEELIIEINTFFIKNVNASVSSFAHQNDFYEYILERLRVQKSIESVGSGLDAIAGIQRHNRDVMDREAARLREEKERKEQEEKEEARRRQEEREKREVERREQEYRLQEQREKEIADQEAERDRKINTMVSMISILAVISAIVDAKQLVMIMQGMSDGTAFELSWQFAAYGIILVFILAILVYVVVIFCKIIRKNREK